MKELIYVIEDYDSGNMTGYRNKKDAHYHKENGEFRGAKIDDSILDEIIEEMFK